MKNLEWNDKISSFKKVDVRGIAGNFLEGLKKQAAKLPVGQGLEVIQTFEPIPLYEVMEMLGYEHATEKRDGIPGSGPFLLMQPGVCRPGS